MACFSGTARKKIFNKDRHLMEVPLFVTLHSHLLTFKKNNLEHNLVLLVVVALPVVAVLVVEVLLVVVLL